MPRRRMTQKKKAYDDISAKRLTIAKGFSERITEARACLRKLGFLEAEYKRYLDLAEGDATIAARFMKSAYPDSPAIVPR